MELEPQLPPELKDAGVDFESIEAESAADLTQDQINEQMRKYNLQPSGSHTDNIQKLQEKFDEEYEKIRAAREDYVEKRRKFDEARKKRAMLEKDVRMEDIVDRLHTVHDSQDICCVYADDNASMLMLRINLVLQSSGNGGEDGGELADAVLEHPVERCGERQRRCLAYANGAQQ